MGRSARRTDIVTAKTTMPAPIKPAAVSKTISRSSAVSRRAVGRITVMIAPALGPGRSGGPEMTVKTTAIARMRRPSDNFSGATFGGSVMTGSGNGSSPNAGDRAIRSPSG